MSVKPPLPRGEFSLKHLFFDETRSAKAYPLLCLIAIDEENREKLSRFLALPNREEFGEDAYRLLYCSEGGELANPEYSFRRMQRAFFTPFTFQNRVREKVLSVLNEIKTLDFEVYLSLYDAVRAVEFNATHSQLKDHYTFSLLSYYLTRNADSINRDSMIVADRGFYCSKDIHVVKSVFRGLKFGVCRSSDPGLKYHAKLFDKVIDFKASYDSKGIQLADIVCGICGRTIYDKKKNGDLFYEFISSKVKCLLDNRDKPILSLGSFHSPAKANQFVDREIKKPDLRKLFVDK